MPEFFRWGREQDTETSREREGAGRYGSSRRSAPEANPKIIGYSEVKREGHGLGLNLVIYQVAIGSGERQTLQGYRARLEEIDGTVQREVVINGPSLSKARHKLLRLAIMDHQYNGDHVESPLLSGKRHANAKPKKRHKNHTERPKAPNWY